MEDSPPVHKITGSVSRADRYLGWVVVLSGREQHAPASPACCVATVASGSLEVPRSGSPRPEDHSSPSIFFGFFVAGSLGSWQSAIPAASAEHVDVVA